MKRLYLIHYAKSDKDGLKSCGGLKKYDARVFYLSKDASIN
jgi:hypothetical protein